MTLAIAMQRVDVDTGSADREGRLIFRQGRLVGLLVRLDGEEHGRMRGRWHVEARFDGGRSPSRLFPTLSDAEQYISRCVTGAAGLAFRGQEMCGQRRWSAP